MDKPEITLLSAADQLDFADPGKLSASLKLSIGNVQKDLLQLSSLTGENKGAITAAAEDLKGLHGKVEAALGKMAQIEQISQALESVRGHLDLNRDMDLRGLKSLRLADKYDPAKFTFAKDDADASWISDEFKDRRGQFALLVASKEELQHLEEKEQKLVARWRTWHDTLSTCHELMMAGKRPEVERYVRRGGIKSLVGWAEFEGMSKQLKLAMDTTTAGEGLEWVPTGVSGLVLQEVYPDFNLRRAFQLVPMPRSPFLYTIEPPFFYAKKAREATSDTPGSNRNLPRQDLTTRNVTFTAQKLAAIIRHSTEIEEDSVVELASRLRFALGLSIEASIESAWVNGQVTAISGTTSTFDTGETFDDGAADPYREDQRAAWDGLRYYASLTGVSEDASTGLIADTAFSLRAKLGRFGKNRRDTYWFTGYKGEARLLAIKDGNGNPVVLTADKMGGVGTFMSGVIGTIAGSPLYISNEWPENLNAAGIADGGGGNYTSIVLANSNRFRHGEVRLTRIEATREGGAAFEQDAVFVKATYRGQGKATVTPSASDKSIGAILGVA